MPNHDHRPPTAAGRHSHCSKHVNAQAQLLLVITSLYWENMTTYFVDYVESFGFDTTHGFIDYAMWQFLHKHQETREPFSDNFMPGFHMLICACA